MTAIVEAYRAGLLQKQHWLRNLVAGVIVGVVALPLAMAFAIASGAQPEQGLYTAIVAGISVSLFGGSRLQIAGPTGAFIVVLAGITAEHGIGGLQIATMMAGLMLFLLGLARMGSIIKYIPDPVIVGFTAGIAVIIWVGQWQYFLGLPAVGAGHFHEKLIALIGVIPEFHLPTALLGLASLLVLIYVPKLKVCRRIPGPLIALVLATLFQALAGMEGISTIGSAFGGIPQGLPSFQLPEFSLSQVIELVGPAFTIAMLGAIESLLSAVVADGMAGTRHDSNQELKGQGIANILAPLFGGFAATGAIARTATNIRNGGNSPIAGIVHALTLVLILIILAPLAVHIPLTALSAVLFYVAWNMSEARHFIKLIRRAPQADVVILLVTFSLTVFADLVVAVNIGVVLAMLHFLRRMSNSVEFRPASESDLFHELVKHDIDEIPVGVLVFTVEGPFFFGAVENFERALAGTQSDPGTLIIRLKSVPFIDATAILTLEEVIQDMQQRGVRVMLADANPRVQKKLRRAGIVELLGEGNWYDTTGEALSNCLTADGQTELSTEDMMPGDIARTMLETTRRFFQSDPSAKAGKDS